MSFSQTNVMYQKITLAWDSIRIRIFCKSSFALFPRALDQKIGLRSVLSLGFTASLEESQTRWCFIGCSVFCVLFSSKGTLVSDFKNFIFLPSEINLDLGFNRRDRALSLRIPGLPRLRHENGTACFIVQIT